MKIVLQITCYVVIALPMKMFAMNLELFHKQIRPTLNALSIAKTNTVALKFTSKVERPMSYYGK